MKLSGGAEPETQPVTETVQAEVQDTPAADVQAARAASTAYYAGYQIKLNGEQDTEGTLAGLTFTLYEKEPGGDWQAVSSKQSQYSSYYRLTFVYFTRMSIEGSPVNEYKVVMSENALYSMEETAVQLDPSNLTTVCGSTIEGNFLNLSRKPVAEDNTEIQVSLGTADWQGQGSQADPSAWSLTVDRFTDSMTVRTAHSQAVITCKGESYTGQMNAELPYGESVWNFSVTSVDGSATQFYQITVTREKYKPLAPSGLTAVSPSVIGGSDGKIQGLDETKLYEYRSQSESSYHSVAAGSTEITGLQAGTYLVRLQETSENAASSDRSVTIKEPVSHSLSLPEENVPEGVEVLECPETMIEGRDFTIRLKLPKNRLLDQVSYTRKAGSMTVSSTLPKDSFAYSQQGEDTIVSITHASFTGDTTLKITLLDGNYYQVTSEPGNGEAFDERGQILFAGEETVQGGIRYFKEGLFTATVNLSEDWKGYAGISSLKAFRQGTEEELPGSLVKVSDEQWYLTIQLTEDTDFYYDFVSKPADLTALNQIIEQIGDMEQYVDNTAREVIEDRLEFLSVYQQQPLKYQGMVDGYVTLLQEAYANLVRRLDLSADPDVSITSEETEHAYDGNPWSPEIAVLYQGTPLAEGTDYKLIFPEDMTSPGQKAVTVEFMGLYSGSRTLNLAIVRYFTITASAGEHGTITPSGAVKVREGQDQAFTVQPENGYRIYAVFVNGEKAELTNGNEYLFQQVSSDAAIEAVFEKIPEQTETEGAGTGETEIQSESSGETETLTESESEVLTESESETLTESEESEEDAETESADSGTAGKGDDSQTESNGTGAAKTGDPLKPIPYMIALFASFGVIAFTVAVRKKRG